MRIVFLGIVWITSIFFGYAQNETSLNDNVKELPQLAILGTFHFAGTNDFSAIVMDSVYSEKRQKQIAEVILKLKQYKPTKILIERAPYLNDSLTKMLKKFSKEPYQLPKNELYQIGFKLAKTLDLDTIYGVDYDMEFEDSIFSTYLTENHLMQKFQDIIKDAENFAKTKTQMLKDSTLLQVLIALNEKEANTFNKNLYTNKLLNISNKTEGFEVEIVSNWYKRNLLIKKQIDHLIGKEDSVLVIIGAGHKAILEDFYRNNPLVTYVAINRYLKL